MSELATFVIKTKPATDNAIQGKVIYGAGNKSSLYSPRSLVVFILVVY